MTRTEFNKYIRELRELGGDDRLIGLIGESLNLRTEARIKYEIKKRKTQPQGRVSAIVKEAKAKEPNYKPKESFRDYISEYPPELHPVYMDRRDNFLQACSLKVKLNSLSPMEEKQASLLQWEIWGLFEAMDRCQRILNHWKETKRILPNETKEDFASIPEKKLDLTLRNLRSNKSRRTKTIQKLKSELPDAEFPDFKTRFNLLNRKIEQLAEIELQIEKLESMIFG